MSEATIETHGACRECMVVWRWKTKLLRRSDAACPTHDTPLKPFFVSKSKGFRLIEGLPARLQRDAEVAP